MGKGENERMEQRGNNEYRSAASEILGIYIRLVFFGFLVICTRMCVGEEEDCFRCLFLCERDWLWCNRFCYTRYDNIFGVGINMENGM